MGGELQGGTCLVIHFHPPDSLIVRLDKDEVVDGRFLARDNFLMNALEDNLHGEEGIKMHVVKFLLDVYLALIGHVKGKPLMLLAWVVIRQSGRKEIPIQRDKGTSAHICDMGLLKGSFC